MVFKKRPKRSMSLNRRIQKVLNKNVETKFNQTSFTDGTIPDQARGGFHYDMTSIAAGNSAVQRTGNQIRLTGLYSELTYRAADSTNRVRVVLYIPKSATAVLSTDVDSVIDADRYTVLHDEVVNLVANTSKDLVRRKIVRNFHKGRRAGILSQYFTTTATDIAKNSLRFYWVSDSLAVNDPTMSGHIKLYFKDA